MNLLVKIASVATIVAAVFTVIAYFDSDTISSGFVVIGSEESQKTDPITIRTLAEANNTISRETEKALDERLSEGSLGKRLEVALKIPGSITKNKTLKDLAKSATDLGYFDLAIKIADHIPGSVSKNSAMSYLALAIGESGNLDLAMAVAEKIPGSVTRSKTLSVLASQ